MKQDDLSAGRDQYRSVSLTYVHVVNLEFSIGLGTSNPSEN